MSESDDREWTVEDEKSVGALPREAAPPSALEARVARRLREEGLLTWRRRPWWLAAAVAACLVSFGAGYAIALREPGPAQADYVLLLRNAPGDEVDRVAEYGAWARSAAERGVLVGGEKLADEAVLLEGGAARRVESGAGEIGGYFLVRAESVDDAVRIARDAPHLGYGGVIEVREIETGR